VIGGDERERKFIEVMAQMLMGHSTLMSIYQLFLKQRNNMMNVGFLGAEPLIEFLMSSRAVHSTDGMD
jgi:sulfatase maturation enzyme AslB (radical SAM superfamily)